MSLNITIDTPEGRIHKSFDDITSMENYFGPRLADLDETPDHFPFTPDDEMTKKALADYRDEMSIKLLNFDKMQMNMPLSYDEKTHLNEVLRLSDSVNLGEGRFVLRGPEHLNYVLSSICHGEQGYVNGRMGVSSLIQCRENVAVYTDSETGVILVDDLLGKAQYISDLLKRDLVDMPSATLTLDHTLEGHCIGPRDLVLRTIRHSIIGDNERDLGFNSLSISADEVFSPRELTLRSIRQSIIGDNERNLAFNSLSIGADESLNFNQPSKQALTQEKPTTLNFTIYSVDGQSKKQFDDILAVESYFGKALRESNVSDDGVQRIEPDDKNAELALKAYREASAMEPFDPSRMDMAIPLREGEKEKLEREFRMSTRVNLGHGRFALRGEDHSEFALGHLCGGDPGLEPMDQCTENTVLYTDTFTGLVLIEDLLGKATSIDELLERPLIYTAGAALTYNSEIFENGSSYIFLKGHCVGPKDLVVRALQISLLKSGDLYGKRSDGPHLSFESEQVDSKDVFSPFFAISRQVDEISAFCFDLKENCNGALEPYQLITQAEIQIKKSFNVDVDRDQVERLFNFDDETAKSDLLLQLTESKLKVNPPPLTERSPSPESPEVNASPKLRR